MSEKKQYEVPRIDVVRVNPLDIKCSTSSDTEVGKEIWGPIE